MSVAVIVDVPPGEMLPGDAVAVIVEAVVADTITGLLILVMLPSVTVIVWDPAVLSVTEKVWVPLSPPSPVVKR